MGSWRVSAVGRRGSDRKEVERVLLSAGYRGVVSCKTEEAAIAHAEALRERLNAEAPSGVGGRVRVRSPWRLRGDWFTSLTVRSERWGSTSDDGGGDS